MTDAQLKEAQSAVVALKNHGIVVQQQLDVLLMLINSIEKRLTEYPIQTALESIPKSP